MRSPSYLWRTTGRRTRCDATSNCTTPTPPWASSPSTDSLPRPSRTTSRASLACACRWTSSAPRLCPRSKRPAPTPSACLWRKRSPAFSPLDCRRPTAPPRGPAFEPFLFLYLRALWKGQGADARPHHHRTRARAEAEGRALLEPLGDLAVALFAEHDRPLLAEFLRASRGYSYDRATAACEARGYHAELVYLLAQTGQTKRALGLIINQLGDVGLAIDFTREQGDAELWDDLLDFSMDKPRFIRGLLERVGTSVDPIRLVRRIPEGLEIEGLRDGVARLMREFEIQGSISEGVARVLRGEVAKGLEALRTGRAVGIRFDVAPPEEDGEKEAAGDDAAEGRHGETPPGHCAECRLSHPRGR